MKMKLGMLAGNIVTVLFILLFLVAAIIILAPFAGWRIDSVLSGSMEPAIPAGGMVIIGPVSASQIHVGDVITFYNGHVEVCHRVIAVDEAQPFSFVTKGDANRSPDGTSVTPEKITGRMVATIPFAGYLLYYMKTPVGLFLTILLPLLFLIGTELKTLFFDKNKEEPVRDPE